jgi:hypothetical protein
VGWYLPAVAAGQADVDCFDIVEGLMIQGGPEVQVLTGLARLGALPAAWPEPTVTTARILTALAAHWRVEGLPAYALFDNDPRFQGTHRVADAIGRVPRLCCRLGIVPVFAPVREPGFLGALENFNGRWQAKVWARFRHPSLAALRLRSARYLAAYRRRGATRLEAAPARRPFPRRWRVDLTRPPRGLVSFLRRTDPQGRVTLLGHRFFVDSAWPHRLVRAEVQLPHGPIRFFALRRRDPAHQPLLREVSYRLPPNRWALTA